MLTRKPLYCIDDTTAVLASKPTTGRVLDELDALGHRDDTVVLFTADHGWGLGEHGMWCKYTIFENQARVPMLVRVPWLPAGQYAVSLMLRTFNTLST